MEATDEKWEKGRRARLSGLLGVLIPFICASSSSVSALNKDSHNNSLSFVVKGAFGNFCNSKKFRLILSDRRSCRLTSSGQNSEWKKSLRGTAQNQ